VDFEHLRCIQLQGENADLRPVFDSELGLYFVQLWKDGELSAIHGVTDSFRYEDEPLDAIDAFLSEHGVTRAVTDNEVFLVYAGLKYARGGLTWDIFCR
jgi:hypothetical protein